MCGGLPGNPRGGDPPRWVAYAWFVVNLPLLVYLVVTGASWRWIVFTAVLLAGAIALIWDDVREQRGARRAEQDGSLRDYAVRRDDRPKT